MFYSVNIVVTSPSESIATKGIECSYDRAGGKEFSVTAMTEKKGGMVIAPYPPFFFTSPVIRPGNISVIQIKLLPQAWSQ